MSRDEYIREYKLYLTQLGDMVEALRELGDERGAKFVESVRRQVDHQDVDSWGPSPKQSAVLEDIKRRHGDVLFDDSKRRKLVEKREEFLERLRKLYNAAKDDGWMRNFLKSIGKQIKKGQPLSARQKDVLRKALEKHKLASESYDRRDPTEGL